MRIELLTLAFAALVYPALAGPAVPELAAATVKLSWNYDGLPKEMRVYELKEGEKRKLWDTVVVKDLKSAPLGPEIKGPVFSIRPGQNKRFVLLFRNTSKETVHFFAAPHQMKPESGSLGFKFKCLCINKLFEVKPGHYWYRVVELRMSPNAKGRDLEITHGLFGVTVEDAKEFKFEATDHSDHDM